MNDESHLYTSMEKIENDRMREDLLYNILMNPDMTELNKTCEFFVKKLKVRYPDGSARFKKILNCVITENNRLIKHSLILFSLYQEPWAVEYFLKEEKTPPTKLSNFVQQDLKHACEQLLKGAFTSMQGFCEDVRWNYVMI